MKSITYRGVHAELPGNISLKCFKQFVDQCGGDYGFTVQQAVNFMSTKLHGLERHAANEAERSYKQHNKKL